MVIIPTEKRFDWKRPPIMLFILVLTNVIIFFVYQGGDEKKLQGALDRYDRLEYFETEWPVYLDYLQSNDVPEAIISDYQTLYNQGHHQQLSFYILSDFHFLDYLNAHWVSFQEPTKGDYWKDRRQIHDEFESTALYGFGLKPKDLGLAELVTYQFLHGSPMHLFGNMFFLVIFGFAVEAAIGHFRFLLFYLVSGIAGGVLFVMVNQYSPNALVGASGAISGVMAMYLGVFRFRKIEFFYWFFVFVGFIRAPALFILPLYIANELYNYLTYTDSNVAFMAHTGGFISGAILILTALLVDPKMLDEEYLAEDEVESPKQRDLDKIYKALGRFSFDTALKALDEFIDTYGEDFDLLKLKYSILKGREDPEQEAALIKLLNMEKLNLNQLERVETLWLDNESLKQSMSNDEVLQLGWRLSALPSLMTSEQIFIYLYSNGIKNETLSHFARKLSIGFGEREHEAKKVKYEKAAVEIYERCRRY
ncbi:rhomboid family intramembrane serine protease [Neptuniibacter sp. 2_MG-2023]|uniref:rhomboid family intramembrane serine protease n=1 Tax=Neptuniibacter sp. 2_MG-2023 TaxID=3062671 RepID=UPI0026E1348E|nr:rhomboid family intramembrane serine protease [Neptuniibacter sp. 2_MG-2023]MDO6514328.1 rhomboid family intramembrane serine protease [Neptuniibacter sp. 2_MG-2023]